MDFLLLLPVLFGNLYFLAAAFAVWRLFKTRPEASGTAAGGPRALEGASVIVPLKGAPRGVDETLRRLCAQDYPAYQIIIAVEEGDRAALPAVDRVRREFPDRDLEIATAAKEVGPNPKEANHAGALRRAKYPLIVLLDGDVMARPDYLRKVLAPLEDPRVGLVTCPYRCRTPEGFWAILESMYIQTYYNPAMLLRAWAAPVRFGLGATLAFRRRLLERIGGFEALADSIHSDFRLAEKIAASGFQVRLLPYWIDIDLEEYGWRGYLAHQVRWVRTMRFTTPGGYLGMILTHGVTWALIFAVSGVMPGAGPALLLGTVAVRVATAAWIGSGNYQPYFGACLVLIPFHDVWNSLMWVLGWTGRSVDWGGRRFHLGAGGRILGVEDPRGPGPKAKALRGVCSTT